MSHHQQQQQQQTQLASAFVATQSSCSAEAHSIVEMRKHTQSNDIETAVSVSSNSSPRTMPSPIPPPSSALPPTPGLSSPSLGGNSIAYRSSKSSPVVVAQSHLPRGVLKTVSHRNTGLTQPEHAELVQLLLTELRPSHMPAKVKKSQRKEPQVAEDKMSQPKSKEAHDKQRSSHSSTNSSIHSSVSTPQLSDSRSATPPTPATPAGPTHDKKLAQPQPEEAQKDVLTPKAALEKLRVLENSFDKSAPSTPLGGEFSGDSVGSQNTAISSAIRSSGGGGEKQGRVSPTNSSGSASSTRPKRNSSYRKSVPRLEEVDTALGISGHQEEVESAVGRSHTTTTTATKRLSSKEEQPSWIGSLSTMEAIRVLAQQKSTGNLKQTKIAATTTDSAEPSDEVNALRYALTFVLLRADALADKLKRVSEEKNKVENELEILRGNVLSMLGSTTIRLESTGGGRSEASHEDEQDDFEDAVSRQITPARKDKTLKPVKVVSIVAPPVSEEARGAVSIASLRRNKPSIAISAPGTQRYEASRHGHVDEGEEGGDIENEEEGEDDDSFEMYPFDAPPVRRAQPEVSMADFLNASRMSKSEIQEHDARRELERDDTDALGYSYSSISSRAPLNGSQSMKSFELTGRGFFKSMTRRGSRRSSLASKPSVGSLRPKPQGGVALTYDEESIIPNVSQRGEVGSGKAKSQKDKKRFWEKSDILNAIPLI